MNRLYSPLIAIVALSLFPSLAVAQPPPALHSWSEQINSAKRFTVLTAFGSAAVLDNETGLVWEQAPATTPREWDFALLNCAARPIGGRKGWRLPSFAELASLVDPTQHNPALPAGHPFSNVQSSTYWSATTNTGTPTNAWGVEFDNGNVNTDAKVFTWLVWCVRGGMNADQY